MLGVQDGEELFSDMEVFARMKPTNVLCVACVTQRYQEVGGGSSMKYYTTTNLVHHLSTKHNGIQSQYLEQKTNKKVQVPK